ncbi:MAG: hypothetical protein LV471_11910 [Nitrosomonas sp.]|nr:hypothetical protein [Nitrosomonas sp.]
MTIQIYLNIPVYPIHLLEQQSLDETAAFATALIITGIRSNGWLSFHTCPQTPCDHPKYRDAQSILNNESAEQALRIKRAVHFENKKVKKA